MQLEMCELPSACTGATRCECNASLMPPPSQVIMPDGWLSWNGNLWGNKPFYGEYKSYGPGARKRRVAWAKPGRMSLGRCQGLLASEIPRLVLLDPHHGHAARVFQAQVEVILEHSNKVFRLLEY